MIQEFFDNILNSQFLESLVTLLMNVLIGIVKIILLPIDLIIKQFFPGLPDILQNVQFVFDTASTYVGWIVSAFAIPTTILSIMTIYYTFVILSRFYMWFIKTALRWVKMLPGA